MRTLRSGLMSATAMSAALALCACGVKKETHQKVLDELTTTRAELVETQRQRDALTREKSGLSTELDKTSAERGQLVKQKAATEAELTELRKQREASEKRLAAFKQLKERFTKLVDTGKLQVGFRNGQMVLKLPSGILFPSGKAELSPEGQTALGEVLGVLAEFRDRRFVVAGHTDTDRIRSRVFKDNWELSVARAISIVKFMITGGFDPKNLAAAGYGEFDPVAPNDSDVNKQLNRRIEIILVPDLSELPNLTSQDP